MPKKPQIDHPVRQVRTALGLTQAAFANRIGCSAIAVQRIENGSLRLSPKLAYVIAEATAADPELLLKGPGAKAVDRLGMPYTKASLELLKAILPMTPEELAYHRDSHARYVELLLAAAERAGKFKAYGITAALQQAFAKLAEDFDLVPSIHSVLVERGSVRRRKYRVEDLRKFPDYARLLGFKDQKGYRPAKVIEFTLPHGWIDSDYLMEEPVLPPGADMKLNGRADYLLDFDRPIPKEIEEAFAQALYWKINAFESVA
jgi:transcriptional regulator with XRE-family HTH domain